MEDYLTAVRSLKCISTIEADDERYLCQCIFDEEEQELVLTCTDIHSTLWEERLTYDDMKFRKKEQKLVNETWGVYIGRIRIAFEHQNLFLDFTNKKYQEKGVLLTTIDNNESIFYHFLLKETATTKSEIANMIFSLLSDMNKLWKLEGECENLKLRLKKQQNFTEMSSTPVNIETIQIKVRSPVKKKVNSRKPGFSIINPQVKRRVPIKGVKIGFDIED